MTINIAKEFSETPGPRYRKNGKFSGEEFREDLLIPQYDEAIKSKEKLTIILDGGYGYPSSFLEEAFGGLARVYNAEDIKKVLVFISDEEPSLIPTIIEYIDKAREK